MARETLFFAQSLRVDGRKLAAGTPEKHRSADKAKEAAERMSATKIGAVVFQVTGDHDREFGLGHRSIQVRQDYPTDLEEAEVISEPQDMAALLTAHASSRWCQVYPCIAAEKLDGCSTPQIHIFSSPFGPPSRSA
jgi:hypothetical protein